MAARYFIPTSGDYAWDGAVWAATASGAAGSAATPVDTDDVYILSGTANITSSLNQSGIQLNSLTIGFSGTIGTAATSLQIGLDTGDTAYIYGSGSINIAITETSGSTLNVYDNFSGFLRITGGAIASIICGRSGAIDVSGSPTIGSIATCGCSITINTVTGSCSLIALGGNHAVYCSMSIIGIAGNGIIRAEGASVAVTFQAYANSGSKIVYTAPGTIATALVYTGGEITTDGTFGGFTVTNSTVYAGGKLFDTPSVPITYTNPTAKYGFR